MFSPPLHSPSVFLVFTLGLTFTLHRLLFCTYVRKSITPPALSPSSLPLCSHIKNLVGCASLCVLPFYPSSYPPKVMPFSTPQHRNNSLTLHTLALSTALRPPSFFLVPILLPWPRNTDIIVGCRPLIWLNSPLTHSLTHSHTHSHTHSTTHSTTLSHTHTHTPIHLLAPNSKTDILPYSLNSFDKSSPSTK